MNRWSQWGYFPPSRPLRAKNGIKPGTAGGGFGKSWWAKRWISTLESFNIGARLQRGRSYARQGQVLSIDVQKGVVAAQVQGSRPRPYAVSIGVKALSDADWKKVGKEFSSQALYAAKLLGGEMPQDIETIFNAASLRLFPEKLRDLQTDCSCPDDSNPCKHIAAVYYLLGEEFDRDPFLIFRMRGLDRNELFDLIGSQGKKARAAAAEVEAQELETEPESAPLPVEAEAFWQGRPIPEIGGGWQVPAVSAALPKRLGAFPFWRGEEPFVEALERIYEEASRRAEGLG